MLVDDPMSDRKAKPRALAVAALGEERLENVLEHVGAHSAAVVGEDHLGHALVVTRVDLQRPVPPIDSSALTIRFENDLLDLLSVDVRHHRFSRMEDDVLTSVLADVTDHLHDALDQAGQLDPLALDVVAAREVEQLLGDVLAAECFFLDHLQVIDHDALVGVVGRLEQPLEPMVERFGAKGDRRQRIVDLVRHAGGQKADAGQSLRPHELPASFLHLLLQSRRRSR